jgi:hypothetical protein
MRIVLALVVMLLAGAIPSTAKADPYRWCGIYGGDSAAATNCYFVNLEQCRMSMSGNGGYCVPNQFYDNRPVLTPGDFVAPTRRRAHG